MKIRTGKGHTSHRDKWEQNEGTNGNRMREQRGTEWKQRVCVLRLVSIIGRNKDDRPMGEALTRDVVIELFAKVVRVVRVVLVLGIASFRGAKPVSNLDLDFRVVIQTFCFAVAFLLC